VVWGKPDDSWLPMLESKEIGKGYQTIDVEEIPEEENGESRE